MPPTERAMVVQHLSNLMTYPFVRERVDAGALALHGWYYRIEAGEVERYDPAQRAFVAVSDGFERGRLDSAA